MSRRGANGTIELNLGEPGETASKTLLAVRAAGANELFTAYFDKARASFESHGWHPGAPPALATTAALPLGRALLALDTRQVDVALAEFNHSLPHPSESPLVEMARLDSEEQGSRQLPAQNTRTAIIQQFAGSTGATAAELYARALAGERDIPRALQSPPSERRVGVAAPPTRDATREKRPAFPPPARSPPTAINALR